MLLIQYKGLQILPLVWILKETFSEELCSRRLLGTTTPALPADNRFALKIEGIGPDNLYIPDKEYTLKLYGVDEQSTFTAFTISAVGDEKPNEKNPRRPIPLMPGRIMSTFDTSVIGTATQDDCPNTVYQADKTPKKEVVALWKSPTKDNKCVTINAYVAVKADVWYEHDGPLSRRVCEDRRKAEDMPPPENPDCRVCEEARYELRFQGSWSYNTHQLMFPKTGELAKFSDIVGASHSKNFHVYKSNTDATDGLRMLAEQGNTTELELEILKELGTNVRTVIKAIAPLKPNMATYTSFRASKEHHYVSLVSAVIPSPDWFLGVSNVELCDSTTNDWAKNITLNMYPLDAGTDSGLTFESPNEETSPPLPITLAAITKDVPKEQVKPFAKLLLTLVRTYSTPDCVNMETNKTKTHIGGGPYSEITDEPWSPGVISEPPLPTDPTNQECPMTMWDEWMTCEGDCEDGKVTGYHSRMRYFIVDGVVVGKDSEGAEKEVSQYCTENYETVQVEKCLDECEEEQTQEPEIEPQRRIWRNSWKPGQSWGGRK